MPGQPPAELASSVEELTWSSYSFQAALLHYPELAAGASAYEGSSSTYTLTVYAPGVVASLVKTYTELVVDTVVGQLSGVAS